MTGGTPRITIVCGHYGVGKSEFSVNLALRMATDGGSPVTLVDLDVVNPYFRSREVRRILEEKGVKVIGNSLGIDVGVDLPAIPASVTEPFIDNAVRAVIDLGGDPAGARAPAQFRSRIPTEDVDFLYVVNAFRPETRTSDAAYGSILAIEGVMSMKVTGLVNNSHLLHETEPEHLLVGDRLCRALETRLPGVTTRYAAALPEVFNGLKENTFSGEPVVLSLYLRSAWMSEGNVHLKSQGG